MPVSSVQTNPFHIPASHQLKGKRCAREQVWDSIALIDNVNHH